MNLHSVDLALAYFPRVVGFRDECVAFDRAPGDMSDGLLAGLYDGRASAERPEATTDAEPLRSCTPLFRRS